MTPTTSPMLATAGQAIDRPAPEDPGSPRSPALRTLLDDLLAERFGTRPAAECRSRGDALTSDGEGAP
jgi:hypothetical protein